MTRKMKREDLVQVAQNLRTAKDAAAIAALWLEMDPEFERNVTDIKLQIKELNQSLNLIDNKIIKMDFPKS